MVLCCHCVYKTLKRSRWIPDGSIRGRRLEGAETRPNLDPGSRPESQRVTSCANRLVVTPGAYREDGKGPGVSFYNRRCLPIASRGIFTPHFAVNTSWVRPTQFTESRNRIFLQHLCCAEPDIFMLLFGYSRRLGSIGNRWQICWESVVKAGKLICLKCSFFEEKRLHSEIPIPVPPKTFHHCARTISNAL